MVKWEQRAKNSHVAKFDGKKIKLAFMSDLHWDNPDCDRDLLKKHLDECLKEGRQVIINGDFFCLMQGKYDPRGSKGKVHPDHQKNNYLDAVIETAVEWFAPYADILAFIGYGNHETSILRRLETDPLRRFVDLFNYTKGGQVSLGGYGGWIKVSGTPYPSSNRIYTQTIYYFHGSGGGGVVTKGTIQNQRQMAMIEGADIITMGHVHELYIMAQNVKYLNQYGTPTHREVWHLRTGTYKDEHKGGVMGWHVERGAPPKALGCVFTDIEYNNVTDKADVRHQIIT